MVERSVLLKKLSLTLGRRSTVLSEDILAVVDGGKGCVLLEEICMTFGHENLTLRL